MCVARARGVCVWRPFREGVNVRVCVLYARCTCETELPVASVGAKVLLFLPSYVVLSVLHFRFVIVYLEPKGE